MEKLIERLMRVLWIQLGTSLALAVLLVCLFEWNVLPEGLFAGDVLMGYVLQTLTILVTLLCLPLALKLYNRKVSKHRPEGSLPEAISNLAHWSGRRVFTISLPIYVGIIAYYFTLNVSHIFCALIACIALCICLPIKERVLEQLDIPVDD